MGAPSSSHLKRLSTPAVDKELALALFAYAAASLVDYLLTLTGLLGGEIRELNPFLLSYIEHFGVAYGLAVPKLILGLTVVTASSIFLHVMHRRRRTRIRPQYILYPGALFTTFAPLHYVILKALA